MWCAPPIGGERPARAADGVPFKKRRFIMWSWSMRGRGARQLIAVGALDVVGVQPLHDGGGGGLSLRDQLAQIDCWVRDASSKTLNKGSLQISTGLGQHQGVDGSKMFLWRVSGVTFFRERPLLDRDIMKGHPTFINRLRLDVEDLPDFVSSSNSVAFLRVPHGLEAFTESGHLVFPVHYNLMAGFPRPADAPPQLSIAAGAPSAAASSGDPPLHAGDDGREREEDDIDDHDQSCKLYSSAIVLKAVAISNCLKSAKDLGAVMELAGDIMGVPADKAKLEIDQETIRRWRIRLDASLMLWQRHLLASQGRADRCDEVYELRLEPSGRVQLLGDRRGCDRAEQAELLQPRQPHDLVDDAAQD